MTTYRVGIHKRPVGADAWVLDLPGCRAIGRDLDEALSLLPVVTAEHVTWLQGHGEKIDAAEDASFEVVEQVEADGEFCFEADGEAFSAEELETALRRSDYAFADLTALAARLPDVVLDWRPPASAVKIDNIYPDVRSIREMLAHASGSGGFFARNVGDDVWTPPPASDADVGAVRRAGLERLRTLSDKERSTVYRRPDPRRGGEAAWSARKVVRRLINHERFHTKEIEQRLAWLLLALPEVMPVSRE
jgi:hypothetical protein